MTFGKDVARWLRLAATAALLTGLAAAEGRTATVVRNDTEEVTPYYEDVAAYVASLGIRREKGTDRTCKNNYYAERICPGIARAFGAFTERFGLEENRDSGRMLRDYIQGAYKNADRLYAKVMGYDFPLYGDYEGVGLEVIALGIKPEIPTDKACKNNVFSTHPCAGIETAWRTFAATHGLALNEDSARLFQFYIAGEMKQGDRLYAQMTGRAVFYELPVHSGIGAEIAALGLRAERNDEHGCTNNYYAANPCPGIEKVWREFAAKHDIEMNYQNAGILVAYAKGDYTGGDRLVADAKGVTVTVLLESRGVEIPREQAEPVRLLVPIRPSGS